MADALVNSALAPCCGFEIDAGVLQICVIVYRKGCVVCKARRKDIVETVKLRWHPVHAHATWQIREPEAKFSGSVARGLLR